MSIRAEIFKNQNIFKIYSLNYKLTFYVSNRCRRSEFGFGLVRIRIMKKYKSTNLYYPLLSLIISLYYILSIIICNIIFIVYARSLPTRARACGCVRYLMHAYSQRREGGRPAARPGGNQMRKQ